MVKINALQVYLQRRPFLLFYRATARQRGNSFPSCAWRISQLHRDFSLAFARRFLDLTTFYDKSADDPFTVITFSVSMLHYLSSVFFYINSASCRTLFSQIAVLNHIQQNSSGSTMFYICLKISTVSAVVIKPFSNTYL